MKEKFTSISNCRKAIVGVILALIVLIGCISADLFVLTSSDGKTDKNGNKTETVVSKEEITDNTTSEPTVSEQSKPTESKPVESKPTPSIDK